MKPINVIMSIFRQVEKWGRTKVELREGELR